MNNYWWLVVIPNLDVFFGILGFMGIIASIIGVSVYAFLKTESCGEKDDNKAWEVWLAAVKTFIVSIILLFITCFIPNKKDIIQLKAISIVSELKGVEKVPQKLIDRLNDLLEEDKKND